MYLFTNRILISGLYANFETLSVGQVALVALHSQSGHLWLMCMRKGSQVLKEDGCRNENTCRELLVVFHSCFINGALPSTTCEPIFEFAPSELERACSIAPCHHFMPYYSPLHTPPPRLWRKSSQTVRLTLHHDYQARSAEQASPSLSPRSHRRCAGNSLGEYNRHQRLTQP